MTKKEMTDEILKSLPEQCGPVAGRRLVVESVMDAWCDIMAAELLGGGDVTLKGIGKLKIRATKARKGHNPRTGEGMDIPAGKRVVFVCAHNLKEALKG